MLRILLELIVPALAAAGGILVLGHVITDRPEEGLEMRLPGTDNRPDVAVEEQIVDIPREGKLEKRDGVPADLPGLWPRFRGPNFDNINRETVKLARTWGPNGPPELWGIDVGEGYAAPAVWKGRVYIVDYDRPNERDVIRCLSLADGKDIWRFSYPLYVKRWHGMSRTIPAVTDTYLVCVGPKCHVTCLDPVTGELKWAIDLVKEWGAVVPQWYAGQCPLIENDRVILAPGGTAIMIAVDAATGKVLWQTPNPHGWEMTHSSIIPMEFKGRRMYVYCASGGVVGVAPDNGALLWETTAWKRRVIVPSPVPMDSGRIFFTAGYNAGSMMLQLKEENGALTAAPLLTQDPKGFACKQQTPIVYRGHLYGVRYDGQLACVDQDCTVMWESGSSHTFGEYGPFMIAQGLLYVMNDDGGLFLVEATHTGFKQFSQAQVLEGHESWGPMALAGGRLIVRDMTRMVCLDVAEK